MQYKLQHLKLGGILDQGIAIVRNHFWLLFSILLITMVPYNLISGGIQLSMLPTLPDDPTAEDYRRFGEATSGSLVFTGPLTLLGLFVVFPLTNAAVIYAVAELYLGKPITAAKAIQKGLSKIGPLVWTSILMFLAIMGGFILLIIPGILFSFWFGLSQHVVVIEDLSGGAALGRSRQLVRPYLGTFIILGLVVFVISVGLGMTSAFVSEPWLKLIVSTLVTAAATVVSTAIFVVFYFSCRCGVENFDLEQLASSIGEEVNAAQAPQGLAAEEI